MNEGSVNATEFKAKCLNLLDQVGARRISRLEITKRGKVVAILIPPQTLEEAVQKLHGFLHGSVIMPKGVDLTAPVLDETLDAEADETGAWST